MFRLATCFLITVAAAGSPWLFGGNTPWFYFLAPILTTCAAIVWLVAYTDVRISAFSWATVAVLALLLGYVLLQAAPLPKSVLMAVTTPARMERIDSLLPVEAKCGPETGEAATASWNRISSDPYETKREWAFLATALAVCIIAMLLAADEVCRLMMVFLLAINGAAFGVLALFMRASSPGMIYWTVKSKSNLPFGAFTNRNHAGLFLALSGLCALFGICLLISQRVARRAPSFDDDPSSRSGRSVSLTDLRMIWLSQKDSVLFSLAFCALFCAVSSIVAASRSGALAFGAVIIVSALMLFISGADRRLILVIGILGGIAAIVSGAKFNFLVERFEGEAVESGWLGRYNHWADVLDQASEFSLTGTGYGTYAYATLPYLSRPATTWFKHADNQFVEIFVELGAVGAILVLAAMILFALRCAFLIRTDDLQSRIVGLFGCGLLAISVINAMGDFALSMPGVLLPLGLAAGFVLGYRVPSDKSSKLNWALIAGSSLLKLATLGVLAFATVLGVSYFATSQTDVEREKDPLQWFARAVSERSGETGVPAMTNDAEAAIAQFVERSKQAVQAVEEEEVDPASYTLENLAMLNQVAAIDDSDPLVKSIREATRDQKLLEVARSNYLTALSISPLRFENHLELAKINLLYCPGDAVRMRIDQVRRINPSSGIDASKAGLVSIINGDFEIGGKLLGQALRTESRLEPQIFNVLKSQMTIQEVLKYVLRDNAPLLIRAADRYYNGKNEWFSRNLIYAQLRDVIDRGETEGLTEADSLYYLAKAKRMTGDYEGAVADLKRACEDQAAKREWFTELVGLYRQSGQLREAIATLKRMQLVFAYDAQTEKQIEALERQQRTLPK